MTVIDYYYYSRDTPRACTCEMAQVLKNGERYLQIIIKGLYPQAIDYGYKKDYTLFLILMRLGRWIWQQLQVCYISCGWGFLLRFSLFSVTAVWFFWFFMFSRGAFSSCCLFGWHQVGKEHFGPSCSSSPFCTSGAWLLMLCCFKKKKS